MLSGRKKLNIIEFLVGILGGIEYRQGLNLGAQPIATDPTIAQAWGQQIFGHYSQVSRSLEVADEQTLAAVIAALPSISAPYLQAAVDSIKPKAGLNGRTANWPRPAVSWRRFTNNMLPLIAQRLG